MSADQAPQAVRRVLISAYTCNPFKGSEPGVGWAWSLAAASRPQTVVHVLTRKKDRSDIERHLNHLAAESPATPVPEFSYLELDRLERLLTKLKTRRLYYALWQVAAWHRLRLLVKSESPDVLHHLTFASDALPTAAAAIRGVPLVWGPVGGAARAPRRSMRYLSWPDRFAELARAAAYGLLRRTFGSLGRRRARLVVTQNVETGRLVDPEKLRIAPNALISTVPGPADFSLRVIHQREVEPGNPADRRLAVFVGRLVGWKGSELAVRAVAASADWELCVVGEGRGLAELRSLAENLGSADRISFVGQLPRDEVFGVFEQADVLLFPSMHDECGWVIAEAQACGCPVICLDSGGPPILAAVAPSVIVSKDVDPVLGLRDALDRCPERFAPVNHWDAQRAAGLLDEWYSAVLRP